MLISSKKKFSDVRLLFFLSELVAWVLSKATAFLKGLQLFGFFQKLKISSEYAPYVIKFGVQSRRCKAFFASNHFQSFLVHRRILLGKIISLVFVPDFQNFVITDLELSPFFQKQFGQAESQAYFRFTASLLLDGRC